MRYLIGRRLRFQVTVTDLETDALVDPDNLTFAVRNGLDGAVETWTWPTDAEVIQASLGTFYVDYTPTVAGMYYYRWSSTGSVEDAVEATFQALPSRVI